MSVLDGPPIRSIPACAGEPPTAESWRARAVVYPRVCGGTAAIRRTRNQAPGLSPRVRGNPRTRLSKRRRPGLSPRVRGNLEGGRIRGNHAGSIPACAGEPAHAYRPRSRLQVYPRVCGGTADDATLLAVIPGLSPRVRGNLSVGQAGGPCLRSIPACAGEPRSSCSQPSQLPVYPRVCGGTSFVCCTAITAFGLSPRVRGNRRLAL